jgi:pilus assembly protein CpaC
MANSTLIRTTLGVAVIIAFGFATSDRVPAAGDARVPLIQLVAGDTNSRFVPLGVGKSVVIDLPRDIKDVLVADPTIANAVVRTARRAYIIGVKTGQTNVFFFDSSGQQIGGLDIAVTRDLNGLRAALKQALPHADIHVEGLGEGVALFGNVTSQIESQMAFDLAARLVEDGKKVVNSITVHNRDQILLKVTVAEMRRDAIKQLGVDLNGNIGSGTTFVNLKTENPFTALGKTLSTTNVKGTWRSVDATLRAMERAGVLRTLAEPTLTAISGESANFLAGGEFPIPGNYTCDPVTRVCSTGVQFKKFGVGLNFTPVVLSEGRISLKVLSEVSELSNEDTLTLIPFSGADPLVIPSIRTRRVESTLEIPSGGSIAMAGMIQDQTKQQINGIPALMNVPILGTLFKSRDYINRQTELAVIVTPYVVRAVAQKQLSRPDDGFADASDPGTVLLGRFNRIYGVPRNVDTKRTYSGNYGFILD